MLTALKGTAAGNVPCGGTKKSPPTSSKVQIIFSFWTFEIRECILRNQKIIIGSVEQSLICSLLLKDLFYFYSTFVYVSSLGIRLSAPT